jgi:hypothetical protein
MEVIATDPAPGARVGPATTVTASVRLGPGVTARALSLVLDGEDVTARCALRTDLAHPPRRADLILPGHLSAGGHEAVVRCDGPPADHAWAFTVVDPGDDPRRGQGTAASAAKEDHR